MNNETNDEGPQVPKFDLLHEEKWIARKIDPTDTGCGCFFALLVWWLGVGVIYGVIQERTMELIFLAVPLLFVITFKIERFLKIRRERELERQQTFEQEREFELRRLDQLRLEEDQRREQVRIDEERRLLRIKNEDENRQNAIRLGAEAHARFLRYLTPCLLFDSNVWMHENYDALFDGLIQQFCVAGYVLVLPGFQFDEISGVKKRSDYDDPKGRRARIAISRVEVLQKSGYLRIANVTEDAKANVYADPLLLKMMLESASRGVASTFVANDIELRIRVREHLSQVSETLWQVVGADELMYDLEAIAVAERFKSKDKGEREA
jgi:hypothetical protein